MPQLKRRSIQFMDSILFATKEGLELHKVILLHVLQCRLIYFDAFFM